MLEDFLEIRYTKMAASTHIGKIIELRSLPVTRLFASFAVLLAAFVNSTYYAVCFTAAGENARLCICRKSSALSSSNVL
jgi:hypothetical protein